MSINYLTKSDFKAARTCPTKLYYRKMGYPTRDDSDEYLKMLAEEGYRIEALARTLFPHGRRLGYQRDVAAAAAETSAALRDPCTLFEATFISGWKMARVDILNRRGRTLELIEIKAGGFNRRDNELRLQAGQSNLFRGKRDPQSIVAGWRPYLEDAAFQVYVLEELFPEATITPYLIMLDTSYPVDYDGLHRYFDWPPAFEAEGNWLSPLGDRTGARPDAGRATFLAQVNVAEEVQLLLPEVRQIAESFHSALFPSLQRLATPVSANCRDCEYRVADGNPNGFRECWAELADVTPHILDLYHVSSLGTKETPLINRLAAQGMASLYDIPLDQIGRRDGALGEVGKRQRLQIDYTRTNREWVSNELYFILDSLRYPLHFVDFETCGPAIPRYRGMRPYETIAFQWCCQAVASPAADPLHTDWLQSADAFPNEEFVLSLRRQVGDSGSILVWAGHESNVLKKIKDQLIERGGEDKEVVSWLNDLVSGDRLVDMNKLTLKHYFHPRMRGSTSLKVVAEAVWGADAAVRERLPQYLSADGNHTTSPYRALPPLSIDGNLVSVAEGTGAILAYYKMMECLASRATQEAGRWRQLLLQYCQLDTLAMVMVWWHWRELTGQGK